MMQKAEAERLCDRDPLLMFSTYSMCWVQGAHRHFNFYCLALLLIPGVSWDTRLSWRFSVL
jgi:hypothetical protein